MLETPELPDDRIVAGLSEHYGIPVTELVFLPIGNDAAAWAYRVIAHDRASYFLKLKIGSIYEPSVLVPRYLRNTGIEEVVAPLPTRNGELWAELDSYNLILYPFIAGKVGMDIGLSNSQWMAFGTILKRIHSTSLPSTLRAQVRLETFVPAWSRMARELQSQVQNRRYDDPAAQALAAFWRDRTDTIARIVDRCEQLGRWLQQQPPPFVLCHTDIHTANILIDERQQLHVVDWDLPLLAPRERDLMFIVGDEHEALFFTSCGEPNIDPVALAYYRYEWVVQEIGDFGERVFLTQNVGEETRQHALRGFMQLFQPGDVIEAAYRSEQNLPPDQRMLTIGA